MRIHTVCFSGMWPVPQGWHSGLFCLTARMEQIPLRSAGALLYPPVVWCVKLPSDRGCGTLCRSHSLLRQLFGATIHFPKLNLNSYHIWSRPYHHQYPPFPRKVPFCFFKSRCVSPLPLQPPPPRLTARWKPWSCTFRRSRWPMCANCRRYRRERSLSVWSRWVT